MIKKLLLVGVPLFGLATVTFGIGTASAHHPDVSAVNVCTDGVPSITVTATAWVTDLGDDHRVNNNVRIDVTGPGTSLTSTGAFLAPDYSIVVTYPVPQAVGTTLTVRATSVAPWGPAGEFGSAGEYREATVDVVGPCTAPTTTAPPTTAPPTTAPPTTVAPVVTTPPTTTAPVEVGGVAVERADASATSAQLAFTGSSSAAARVSLGVVLVMAGLGLTVVAKRRRA